MKVVIIGTGTMGEGISKYFSSNSIISNLIVIGRTEENLESTKISIQNYLNKLVKRNVLNEHEKQHSLNKISFCCNFSYIRNADLIIEAVSEDVLIKEEVFRSISEEVSPKTIVATNTSSLSVTYLASFLPAPEKCLGLHFFNPVTHMELVEVVAGYLTSKDTIDTALKFIESLPKKAVLVEDSPGFIVNRMLIPMINEAVAILAEGIASTEDIDKAMKWGANHPMGPLFLSDLIGNDVTLSIMDTLKVETGDTKYRAHPLLRRMVRAGALGRKSKKGFYNY